MSRSLQRVLIKVLDKIIKNEIVGTCQYIDQYELRILSGVLVVIYT